MISLVLRVWLPDRPGALGLVASRIGAVRGDLLGIEILEQGADRVVDELTIALPDAGLIPLLTAEVDAVDGVSVEDVRIVESDRADPNLAALAVGAAMAECPPGDRLDVFCSGLKRLLDADWVAVLRHDEPIAQLGEVPDLGWVIAFLAGTQHLGEVNDSVPGDMVWAHLVSTGLYAAAGRSDRPIHERERVRISLLARLADALLA